MLKYATKLSGTASRQMGRSIHQYSSLAKSLAPLASDTVVNRQVLHNKINNADFYKYVAQYDQPNQERWLKMNNAMLSFAELESELKDYEMTHQYSQMMRSTLHVYLRDRVEELDAMSSEERTNLLRSGKFYQDYIAFHAQAFKQNGACSVFVNHPILSCKILLAPIHDDTYTFGNVSTMLNAIREGVQESGDDEKYKLQAAKAIEELKDSPLVGDVVPVESGT